MLFTKPKLSHQRQNRGTDFGLKAFILFILSLFFVFKMQPQKTNR